MKTIITLLAVFYCCSTGFAAERDALPIPDPDFKGKIGKSYADSQQDFPQPISAPKGAPNVVLILLDDLSFGQPGTFGGPIPTPNLDKLATQGLRYNRFHTTAICSPTRAALLTAIAKPGSPGTVVIQVDGTEYARLELKQTVALAFTASETFDVGTDLGSPVSKLYYDRRPFAFTGKIEKIAIALK